ncbi:MAG: DUF4325 domain-containing protein [Actinomycetota bacterium]
MPQTRRRSFGFAGFVELYRDINHYLDTPQSIAIDLSRPFFFTPDGMAPLLCLIDYYTAEGWEFVVELPEDNRLRNYFDLAGWIAAIQGTEPPPPGPHSTFTPLIAYSDHDQLNGHINETMDVVAKVTEYGPGVLQAVEWVVNEIADNVLVHADGALGWVQTVAYPKNGRVSITVSDCGPGILGTMKQGFPDLETDRQALGLAIERGVTRNKAIGQGNGLAGSLRIAEAAGGWVNLMSGSANLRLFDDGHYDNLTTPPFTGTIVTMTLPVDAGIDIAEALWGHQPSSTFEFTHVSEDGIVFRLFDEATGFGNRGSGEELANKLRNIMQEFPDERVVLDFESVDVASASFLDEFLAKMIKTDGVTAFFSRFILKNMNDFVRRTADAVIAQRLGDS